MEHELELLITGGRFKKLYEKMFEDEMIKYNLCRIDIEILCYLNRYSELDTARDIVIMNAFNKGHVSQALKRLEKQEYVKALSDGDDLRISHLKLTEEGMLLVEELDAIRQRLFDNILEGITQDERKFLCSIAQKIEHNIKLQID